jgi:hypothetical protein
MKKSASILFTLLLAGGFGSAFAQETNSESGTDFNSFDIIARKNIFDQSRVGILGRNRPAQRVPQIDRLTLLGIGGDHGNGEVYLSGAGGDRFLKVGDHIDGFAVNGITLDSVRLVNASNTFVLDMDKRRSLRRMDDGPWEGSSDISEPVIASNSSDASAATGSSATAAPDPAHPGETDTLRKLRLRREQEEK